jgi:putative transposase
MTNYRRIYIPSSTWFFTVNLAERRNNYLLVEKIDLLRAVFRYVKERKPYRINAVVISALHLDIAAWGREFFNPLESAQRLFFTCNTARRENFTKLMQTPRAQVMATSVLGTCHL